MDVCMYDQLHDVPAVNNISFFVVEFCQGERRDNICFFLVRFFILFLLVLWLLLDDRCRHDVRLLSKRTSKF